MLHAKVKPKKKVYPFVTEFNPRAPNISQIISKHKHLISTPEWKEIFPDKSKITAHRRPKNLKDILAPSKFDKQHVLAENQRPGCFKCKRKCDLCNPRADGAKRRARVLIPPGYLHPGKRKL